MRSQRTARYDSPWRRLPWTGPLAVIAWALALWSMAVVLTKQPAVPQQVLPTTEPTTARFIELPKPAAPEPVVRPVVRAETPPKQRVKKRPAARSAAKPPVAQPVQTNEPEQTTRQVTEAAQDASQAARAAASTAQVALPGGTNGNLVASNRPRFANHPGAAVRAKAVGVIPPPQDLTIDNEENPFDDGNEQGRSLGGWTQESAAEDCIAIWGEEGPCDKALFSQPGRPWCYDANPYFNWDFGTCQNDFGRATAAFQRKDYETALALFTKLADKDYGPAQANLCTMYAQGDGVQQETAKAAQWCRKAADIGDPKAAYNLALMYGDGTGVPRDERQAAHWYRKAAYAGYAVAQYNLGVMYALGSGVPQDDKQAAFWYRRAANRGNAAAQYNLGVLYAEGAGVPQDDKKAVYWYCKGTIRNEEKAQASLARMLAIGAELPNAAELKYFCWLLSADKRHSFIAYQDRHLYEKDLDADQRARAIAAVGAWKER